MKTLSELANDLYNAVIDAEGPDTYGLAVVIHDAASMREHADCPAAMHAQATETMHDYALMLAASINPAFDADAHLKHPAPHDDIVGALEESGLLTNE